MSVASQKKEIHRRPKPLTDVRAKLRRAAQHTAEVRDYISSKHAPQLFREAIKTKPAEPGVVAEFALPSPIDHDLPMMVGEAIQSLREVLDYLVYDLVWVDTGQIPEEQERTQFPIFGQPADFDRFVEKALAGLNSQHRKKLESLQPYNECQWTPLLQRYSNRDKHRHPVAITWSGNCGFDAEITLGQVGEATFTADRKIRLNFKADLRMSNAGVGDRVELRINSESAQGHTGNCCTAESINLRITFDGAYYLPDGRPMPQTLSLLQDEVTKLVEGFETELQEAAST
jgi:hypothetical protein